jgi:hypothetical protein
MCARLLLHCRFAGIDPHDRGNGAATAVYESMANGQVVLVTTEGGGLMYVKAQRRAAGILLSQFSGTFERRLVALGEQLQQGEHNHSAASATTPADIPFLVQQQIQFSPEESSRGSQQ